MQKHKLSRRTQWRDRLRCRKLVRTLGVHELRVRAESQKLEGGMVGRTVARTVDKVAAAEVVAEIVGRRAEVTRLVSEALQPHFSVASAVLQKAPFYRRLSRSLDTLIGRPGLQDVALGTLAWRCYGVWSRAGDA